MKDIQLKKQSLAQAIKSSLAISLPVAGIFLVNILTGFIAVLYLSRFGEDVLAASALMIGMQITIFVICKSSLFSVSIMVGRTYGAGDTNTATRILQQSWMLGIAISFIVLAILSIAPKLLLMMGQPKALVSITAIYLKAIAFAAFPLMLLTACQQFAVGVMKQKLVVISSLLGLLTMICLGYILGFGHFGSPKLGVRGVGYAVAAQYLIGLIYMLCLFLFNPYFKPFKIFKLRAVDRFSELKKVFKLGWPISMQVGAELLAIFFITIMTGWLGEIPLSARQVTSQYLVFTVVPIIGISQACGVLVSHTIGKESYHDVSRIVSINIALAFVFMLGFFIAFLFIPNTLASLYLSPKNPSNAHVYFLIQALFIIACISQSFDSVRNITSGALRGLYDSRYPMIIGTVALWLIAIPIGYILAFYFNLGVIGLSIGFTIGVAVAAILQIRRWREKSHHTYLQKNALNCIL